MHDKGNDWGAGGRTRDWRISWGGKCSDKRVGAFDSLLKTQEQFTRARRIKLHGEKAAHYNKAYKLWRTTQKWINLNVAFSSHLHTVFELIS